MKTRNVTSLIAGTGLLLAGAAPALATTVDGINIPTTSGPHTFAGTITENTTTQIGGELTGDGTINTFDGDTNFCATSGCSLTYEFGGFTLADFTPPSTTESNTGQANFTGGFVNFYANGDMDNPWLTTEADSEQGSIYTLEGTLKNALDENGDYALDAQNTAIGLLSVTGGSAASVFDNDSYENGDGGLSDLLFNTSLSPQGDMTFRGSADAHYISENNNNNVPEPGALAMLGLGLTLVGFGATYRRRKG